MAATPKSYGDAQKEAARLLGAARLADPNSHFPYKHKAVVDLIRKNPPMGPGTPGEVDGAEDRSREVADYMTREIADATKTYVAAQARYYESLGGSDEDISSARAAYEAARDELVAARLDHRINRGNSFTVGAAARRAG